MHNLIVLEDNREINDFLTTLLDEAGYQVFSSTNAFDALEDFNTNSIDCIITDLMLPVMSGEAFIKKIRKESNVHIIVISAKTQNEDKIEGLKIGADDYLFKPFLKEEVLIKLENFFQKRDQKNSVISLNNKEIIFSKGTPELIIEETHIELTTIEYHIMMLLLTHINQVLTRDDFLDYLYAYGDEVYDRVVDVHIKNIRKKIKPVYQKTLIKTVYGLGYQLVGETDE
ncbi:MAG: response regulator transcription factor [Candidatus Izimaplasma sp.]|nr:response regulator transcription factor [Candidatus Izimaplasma bacterium]